LSALPVSVRFRLRLQRAIAHATALLWLPLLAFSLRFGGRWRIEGASALREAYRELRSENAPLLICPNHLTMIDSALVASALGSPAFFLRHFAALPWNLPEQSNFAASPFSAVIAYLLKCLPLHRGGSRRELGGVLDRAAWLLQSGETVLVFPEGRRSRSGRVERDAVTWGPGRLLGAVANCRVLCIYMRGDRQTAMSALPARGQTFRVDFACIEPKTELKGLRRSLDLTQQILATLAGLEARYFDAR
jgi:1-acyl-sn-glycerol-3-phosphate acyltransferase